MVMSERVPLSRNGSVYGDSATVAPIAAGQRIRGGRNEEWKEEPDWQHWASFSADALLPVLVNDLEAAAFEVSPDLARLREGTQALLGRVVRMSGSGSTLFTLFDDESAASQAAEAIRTQLRTRAAAVPLAPTS